MNQSARRQGQLATEPVRVLGRGLRAHRGVHLTMRAVREAIGKTQVEVATESRTDQADVSRLEAREDFDDCQVSTLRRYVAALGGRLDLVAVFGDRRIAIVGAVPPGASIPRAADKALQKKGGRRPARR